MPFTPPDKDCPRCPRLCGFREENRRKYPTFYNAPVPSFGLLDAEFLVVGLAPGLKGANQTGRPFTGDYAGIILYNSLLKYGFAEGNYNPQSLSSRTHVRDLLEEDPSSLTLSRDDRPDTLKLKNCRITNAVRCVPQENKPENSEIKNCNSFLKEELAAMPNLKVILSLGLVSHGAVLGALGQKASFAKFGHGAQHVLPRGITLIDSYHCSRYNINTGRLTPAMFDVIVGKVKQTIS